MKQCLDHYNPSQTVSQMEWQGSHSQRFKGGKHHLPMQDSFYGGTVITNDPGAEPRGRRHLFMGQTDYVTPRSTIRTFDLSKYPASTDRPQGKRTTQFQPLPIKPRPQRLHIADNRPQITRDQLPISIKTFQEANRETVRDWRVEDRMQRKVRSPVKLNSSAYYGQMPWLGQSPYNGIPYHEDFGAARMRTKRQSLDHTSNSFNTTAGNIFNISANKLPPSRNPLQALLSAR